MDRVSFQQAFTLERAVVTPWPRKRPMRAAILDDYQNVALRMADWDSLKPDVSDVQVFTTKLSVDEVEQRLKDFDCLVCYRERTPFSRAAGGPIVDEKALVAALQQGKIAGAGLDVFETEPLPTDHPLTKLDNVVLTSHVGGTVEETYQFMYGGSVDAIRAFLNGRALRPMNEPLPRRE